MRERFNIGESGPLTWFLGISFKWGDGSLTMKHQGYVSNLLRKHGMGKCKAASTPLADKLDLTKDQMPEDGSDEQQQMLRHDYRGLVGSIAYLSLSTRPDLAFLPDFLAYFLDFLATLDLLTGKQRSTCYGTSEVQLTWASLS